MCAQFVLRTQAKILAKQLGISLPLEDGEVWDELIVPHLKAPVVVQSEEGVQLVPMVFSLLPYWSRESSLRFSTHNARLQTGTDWIFDKPTWKKPFLSQHCIVPMTSFIEPIYVGDFAGNMVEFSAAERRDGDPRILLAAGVWDYWRDLEQGEERYSFAIITDNPQTDVQRVGHDRSPLFLKDERAIEWLSLKSKGAEMVEFLRSSTEPVPMEFHSFRAMKPGWQKRIPKS